MTSTVSTDRVSAVRGFNRFYTNVIGLLGEGHLHSPYSLTQVRVLFELAQREVSEVAELRRVLDLDAGYLSRILAGFEADGLVRRERSSVDARRQVIRLTDEGRTTFANLDSRSSAEIDKLLAPLAEEEQRRVVGAMDAIRRIIETRPRPDSFVLRPLGPGDCGWVVHRHGVRYAAEYGWDTAFEALVARIVADYLERQVSGDGARESGWIAEVDGEPVGSIFCMNNDPGDPESAVAKLRLLLVEPRARGMGIGARLVDECVRFARRAGYARIDLWTNDVLVAARRVYEQAGFELVEEGVHNTFGPDLVEQVWRRELTES